MSRRHRDDDEWMDDESMEDDEDEGQGELGHDEFDSWDDEDAAPTIDCPYCQAEIHEDSERCPFCENYLSLEDSPAQSKPLWIVLGVLLCLLLVLLWILP